MQIAVSPFVKRQTIDSRFSHFEGSWDELAALVQTHFPQAQPGYREGVVLVPVPPERFWSPVVTLVAGDEIFGRFEARQPGEEPRKSTYTTLTPRLIRTPGGKAPAVGVDVVLYRHDVLAENDEQSCDAEWEIICINARPTEEEMPMSPDTLMANHFQISGGTATNMSDREFVEALRKSFLYWRDKELMQPPDAKADLRDRVIQAVLAMEDDGSDRKAFLRRVQTQIGEFLMHEWEGDTRVI